MVDTKGGGLTVVDGGRAGWPGGLNERVGGEVERKEMRARGWRTHRAQVPSWTELASRPQTGL